MHRDVVAYNAARKPADKRICDLLSKEIDRALPEAENKIWHAHPVWFLNGNPIVGYHELKDCVRLLFWSGRSFDEAGLKGEGSFKAAEARFTSVDDVDAKALARWLKKSRDIQWDYKNIMKRKGRLVRLMPGEAPADLNTKVARKPKAASQTKSKAQSKTATKGRRRSSKAASDAKTRGAARRPSSRPR
jgi:hypothetical protein